MSNHNTTDTKISEILTVAAAGQQDASFYQSHYLNHADALRVAQHPHLEQRIDWKTSRVLKYRAREWGKCLSLSHSHGAALIVSGSMEIAVGADLEKMCRRDFSSLCAWFANDCETDFVSGLPTRFYALWTLKEALLKAEGLSFPEDMRRVGLYFTENKAAHIMAPSSGWQVRWLVLPPTYMAAIVWKGRCRWRIMGGLRPLHPIPAFKNQ